MREYITPERIANQIRLRRSNFSGAFIIVEGRSDNLVYERLVSTEKCEFSIALNKDNAINALNILNKDNFKGVQESYFRSTQLYTSIQNWENNNHPYQIIKQL